MGMTIDEAIRRIDEHNYIHQNKEPRAVYITEAFDGCSFHAHCKFCGKEIMQDSQGNWF